MKQSESYRQFIERMESSPEYAADVVALEVADELLSAVRRSGLTLADLARTTGVSEAHFRRALRGDVRLSARTMSRLTTALGTSPSERAVDSTRCRQTPDTQTR